jgi:hypothetical protein
MEGYLPTFIVIATCLADHQTSRPADHQTIRPSDHQTSRPADQQTSRPADQQTCHSSFTLSKTKLKIF